MDTEVGFVIVCDWENYFLLEKAYREQRPFDVPGVVETEYLVREILSVAYHSPHHVQVHLLAEKVEE